MLASILGVLLAAISLDGVTGRELAAQASLDALNVRIGDPLTLTVDFYGTADFASIHPPELSRYVDAKVWKVDDASAKTETYRNARRLVYRVRPRKVGLVEFPSLSFSYDTADGGARAEVSTEAIPVHVKPGSQVALAELDEVKTRAFPRIACSRGARLAPPRRRRRSPRSTSPRRASTRRHARYSPATGPGR